VSHKLTSHATNNNIAKQSQRQSSKQVANRKYNHNMGKRNEKNFSEPHVQKYMNNSKNARTKNRDSIAITKFRS
jgi:hypothetical protein